MTRVAPRVEASLRPGYWSDRPLWELSPAEWEALCDGCGRCCLYKLEEARGGRLLYTRVACRCLDITTCRCTVYHRRRRVSGCLNLRTSGGEAFRWLPLTCAYRRLFEGKGLPAWHPLISGDPATVRAAGVWAGDYAIHLRVRSRSRLMRHIIETI